MQLQMPSIRDEESLLPCHDPILQILDESFLLIAVEEEEVLILQIDFLLLAN